MNTRNGTIVINYIKCYNTTVGNARYDPYSWPKRVEAYSPIKEARKGLFGCYSVCETMKDTKEG